MEGAPVFSSLRTPEAVKSWGYAYLGYDSTLGFAGHSGFRCGVGFEYPVSDVINREALKLKECPLVEMECVIISERYMNLGYTSKYLEKFYYYRSIYLHFSEEFNATLACFQFLNMNSKKMYVNDFLQ